MLKIRLQRVGRKHEPTFRLVLTDSQNSTKSGRFLEILGSHDPRDRNISEIKGDRVQHWISKGAQVSDTVHNLLVEKKIIQGKKVNVLPKKTPIKKEGEEASIESSEAVPAPEAAPAETSAEDAPKEEAPAA